jgi:protein-L-isoaspartate O-methyltransferase
VGKKKKVKKVEEDHKYKGLDIGTGSGYVSAIMAEALGENGIVYSVDHV